MGDYLINQNSGSASILSNAEGTGDKLTKASAPTGNYLTNAPAPTGGYLRNINNKSALSFWAPLDSPTMSNLDLVMTINGTSVSPTYAYRGDGPTSGSATWSGLAGSDLTRYNTGSPNYQQPTPLSGATDLCIEFNNDSAYRNTTSGYGQPGTGDLVWEVIARLNNSGFSSTLVSNKQDAVSTGFAINHTGAGVITIDIDDGSAAPARIVGTPGSDCWFHAIIFFDRDEASNNGFRTYMNAINGAASDMSAYSGALTNSAHFAIAALNGGDSTDMRDQSAIAWVAQWESAGWFAGGAQNATDMLAVAKERLMRLTGMWPTLALGTDVPTVYTRATAATTWREVSSARRVFEVASGWPRIANQLDTSSSEVSGLLCEQDATNRALRAKDYSSATWQVYQSTKSFGQSSPDGLSNAGKIVENTANDAHWIFQTSNTVDSTDVIYSLYVKKAGTTRDWFHLSIYRAAPLISDFAFFDVENGTVGSLTGVGNFSTGGIEDVGNGWFRIWVLCNTIDTSALGGLYLGPASADGTHVYTGDPTTYPDGHLVWGAQLEVNTIGRPTSPICTLAAAATRNADVLYYKGDDGNIGGVGSDQRGKVTLTAAYPNQSHTAAGALVSINDGGSSADKINLEVTASDVPDVNTRATAGNDGDVTATTDVIDGDAHDLETRWKADSVRLFVDSTEEGTEDTSADMPDTLDRINVGSDESGANQPAALISALKIYKRP